MGSEGQYSSVGDQDVTVIACVEEDLVAANRLFNDLKAAGKNLWLYYPSLLPGQDQKNVTEQVIEESRYFIALFSSTTIRNIGNVHNQFKYALKVSEKYPPDAIYIIPVRLDDCKIPYPELHSIRNVDLFPLDNQEQWNRGIQQILRAMNYERPQKQVRELKRTNETEHSTMTYFWADIRWPRDRKRDIHERIYQICKIMNFIGEFFGSNGIEFRKELDANSGALSYSYFLSNAFFFIFRNIEDALKLSMDLHHKLATNTDPRLNEISVRIGISAEVGQVEWFPNQLDRDFLSPMSDEMILARRIMHLANDNQILLSSSAVTTIKRISYTKYHDLLKDQRKHLTKNGILHVYSFSNIEVNNQNTKFGNHNPIIAPLDLSRTLWGSVPIEHIKSIEEYWIDEICKFREKGIDSPFGKKYPITRESEMNLIKRLFTDSDREYQGITTLTPYEFMFQNKSYLAAHEIMIKKLRKMNVKLLQHSKRYVYLKKDRFRKGVLDNHNQIQEEAYEFLKWHAFNGVDLYRIDPLIARRIFVTEQNLPTSDVGLWKDKYALFFYPPDTTEKRPKGVNIGTWVVRNIHLVFKTDKDHNGSGNNTYKLVENAFDELEKEVKKDPDNIVINAYDYLDIPDHQMKLKLIKKTKELLDLYAI